MEVTGIILAGGKSSRMGCDKALIQINGKHMIDYSIEALTPVCRNVIISANQFTQYKNFEICPDNLSITAPIIGIFSCLTKIKTTAAFVLSCDMPLIDQYFVKYLLSFHSDDFEITIPVHNSGKIEPLCAVYSVRVLEKINAMIMAGNYKLQDLINNSVKNVVDVKNDYRDFNPIIFSNINSPEDLENLSIK